jgi:hypothetical protein
MGKVLFVCNSVYQVLIASWINYKYYQNDECDIIISNHMNGHEEIANNLRTVSLFNNVYTANSKSYVYNSDRIYKNKFEHMYYLKFPKKELAHYIDFEGKYDILFIANYDTFASLLYNALCHNNKHIQLNYFDDGAATYSLVTKEYYESSNSPKNALKKFVFKNILNCKYIYNNVSNRYLVTPELVEWRPDNCNDIQIATINTNDDEFKKIINTIFDYSSLKDTYDEKYIFFEESFYAETGYMEDVELVEEISNIVGKENMLIKIHPRNPENRFEKLGYKTNKNTAIPWEVILMNINCEDKILITISSTSILTPSSCFGKKIKSYSLIKCINNVPKVLQQGLAKSILNLYCSFDNIKMITKISDINSEEN